MNIGLSEVEVLDAISEGNVCSKDYDESYQRKNNIISPEELKKCQEKNSIHKDMPRLYHEMYHRGISATELMKNNTINSDHDRGNQGEFKLFHEDCFLLAQRTVCNKKVLPTLYDYKIYNNANYFLYSLIFKNEFYRELVKIVTLKEINKNNFFILKYKIGFVKYMLLINI